MAYRVRERDNSELAPGWDYTGQNTDGTSVSGSIASPNPSFYIGQWEKFRDIVTPDFHRRSRAGEIIVNPFQKTLTRRIASPGNWGYTIDGTPFTFERNHPNSWRSLENTYGPHGHISIPVDIGNLLTLAGTQARANVNDPEIAGFVLAGEIIETLALVGNPLRNWGKFLRRIRKIKNSRSFSKAYAHKTVYDFLSDNWLTWRYAIRPFVSEIENAVIAIEKANKAVPPRFTARGFANWSDDAESDKDINIGNGGIYNLVGATNHKIEVRAGILYELEKNYYPDYFGTSVKQIPAVAWELITLSFVVDWFANVESFINAITPNVGVKVLGSWTTIRHYQNSSWQSKWIDGNGRDITSDGTCLEQYQTISTTRSPGTRIGLAFKPHALKGDMGQARLIDLFAIARKLLQSK